MPKSSAMLDRLSSTASGASFTSVTAITIVLLDVSGSVTPFVVPSSVNV
ncbi:MAG: hypothetical protein HZA46_03905 [Planctomycetales bacterium]|nr:hypothetical protein [Planctomycetales bacterium]